MLVFRHVALSAPRRASTQHACNLPEVRLGLMFRRVFAQEVAPEQILILQQAAERWGSMPENDISIFQGTTDYA